MRPEDFELFATQVKLRSGLQLTPEKAYLLESRLLPVAQKYNLKSLEDLARAVRVKRDETMLNAITVAMTTNESHFYRDQKPFTQFQNILLPQLLQARADRKHIRIWSAATSSGQEAYSLAMICAEEAEKLKDWKIDIIGTDLSREMIEKARAGIYSQFEVQRGLPITMLVKHFQQLSGDKWQIKESIRQMVEFHEQNLIEDFGPVGIFDIIYCRNVLVYFDQPTKKYVLDSIASVMAPEGNLFLGANENINGITDKFSSPNECGVHRRTVVQ